MKLIFLLCALNACTAQISVDKDGTHNFWVQANKEKIQLDDDPLIKDDPLGKKQSDSCDIAQGQLSQALV